ncbi:MAG: hypothetical protein Terrestrivirus8_32 [Terrestrivirus sp.]|uniref:Uncharacterized protein n=1 Tax=Terrestrivirus sp. TaxID=2487775 RepID=A0A3G4ZSW6_9VIRU|nr:MAG: hypothetical protein Terrestrivirus8_32 [Terrestrivirus sp.]
MIRINTPFKEQKYDLIQAIRHKFHECTSTPRDKNTQIFLNKNSYHIIYYVYQNGCHDRKQYNITQEGILFLKMLNQLLYILNEKYIYEESDIQILFTQFETKIEETIYLIKICDINKLSKIIDVYNDYLLAIA